MDEEPDWLDDEERGAWMALSAVVMTLPAALDAQLQRDSGMTHFEYLVLAMLSETPDHTRRMSELALVANGSLSRLSHVVKRLEKRGWVERSPDPEDGRYTRAALTEEGWRTLVAAAPGHVATVRRLVFDHLTRVQVRQLDQIGHRVFRGIAPEGDC